MFTKLCQKLREDADKDVVWKKMLIVYLYFLIKVLLQITITIIHFPLTAVEEEKESWGMILRIFWSQANLSLSSFAKPSSGSRSFKNLLSAQISPASCNQPPPRNYANFA